jgi:hypothetical protein
MPRILRNLKIAEVSGVDIAANKSARILLAKRDDARAPAALAASVKSILADDTVNKAEMLTETFQQFLDYVGVKKVDASTEKEDAMHTITKSDFCAQIAALGKQSRWNEGEQQRWADLKKYSAADVLLMKLGGGSALPQHPQDYGDTAGGRVASPTRRTGHGASSNNPNPHRDVRHDVPEDGNNGPDDDVAEEAFKRFTAAVNQCCADGMSRSAAMDHVMQKFPALWGAAKQMKIKGSVIAGG